MIISGLRDMIPDMEKRILTFLDSSKPWSLTLMNYLSTLPESEVLHCEEIDEIPRALKSGKDYNLMIIDPYRRDNQDSAQIYSESRKIHRDNPEALLLAISEGFTDHASINLALLKYNIDNLIIIPENDQFDEIALFELNGMITSYSFN
jgi:hypothetical protein